MKRIPSRPRSMRDKEIYGYGYARGKCATAVCGTPEFKERHLKALANKDKFRYTKRGGYFYWLGVCEALFKKLADYCEEQIRNEVKP